MPPRFTYWTIIAGGLPTSFRAADKNELMPTFRRLKERHPDAEMKYFARGKLWESADEARRVHVREVQAPKPQRDRRQGDGERRGRNWRPGGEHRDPRQAFKDAKQARNRDRRQQRWRRRQERQASAPPLKPHGDKFRDKVPRREYRPRPSSEREPHPNREPPPSHEPRPSREPRPEPQPREPKPEPPPRPSEPRIKPPGPPERGRRSDAGADRRNRRRKA